MFFFIVVAFCGGIFISCADLNVPSPTILTDDDVFTNDETIELYIARLYSQMPFECFKWSPDRQYFDRWLVIPDANSGQCIHRDSPRTFTSEGNQRNGEYWSVGYQLLRDANYLLETISKYEGNFNNYNHYIGEAYFSRAMVYYALARRYGGVPIVNEVLKYPDNEASALEVPRATEADTWDEVLSNFDLAISYLNETSPKRGYSNKDVALSFKAAAMLYAGSVAKYNNQTGLGAKTGVRVQGFDPGSETTYAKKYFKEAYLAARAVIGKDRYSLYGADATDPETQFKNMVNMFFDTSSPENIYIKEYSYGNSAHGYDVYAVPRQLMGGGYTSEACPPLDFVEMYELPDIDRYPDGTLKNFDLPDKNDPNRKYLMYDSPMDIFKNAEPRLRAYVCFPMDVMKGEVMDIRTGIFRGAVTNGISPLLKQEGTELYSSTTNPEYQSVDAFTGRGEYLNQVLYVDRSSDNRTIVTLDDGRIMNASGINGPYNDANCANTGFTIRKWIVEDKPTSEVTEGNCTQHFVLMRYAEVLLTMAEAACELSLLGESSPDGADMRQLAEEAIKAIRSRAGATVDAGLPLVFNEDGKMLIRKERQKELAYEHKNVWDIRRWRTHHTDKDILGNTYNDGYRFRGLYPFYSEKANKYFFDIRLHTNGYTYTFRELNYYLAIPSSEVSKSSVIDQQPFR